MADNQQPNVQEYLEELETGDSHNTLIFSHVDPARPVEAPKRQHVSDCGYDMFADDDYTILPGEQVLVGHNLRVQLPPGCFAVVVGRSSNWKRKLEVGLGVIDNGYRGPMYARVLNLSDEEQAISKGDRVAQLILIPMFTPPTEYRVSLDDSDRGERGFGSTGT